MCPVLMSPIDPNAPHFHSKGTSLGRFTGRLLVILVIASLAAALWQLIDILVLLFGAVLLAIGLCAAARQVSRYTGVRRSFALARCLCSVWPSSVLPSGSSDRQSPPSWTT